MPKAPKNWRKVGYILPEVIEPDENICICVPIPKDWGHARAFLGQITELSKWLTWEKDGTDSAARTARRWFDIAACVAEEIDCAMANKGCGCGDPVGRIYRHNPDTDRLEQSDDDGETWQNAPDPRYDSPVFSPQEGDTEADTRCLSATNATLYFKDELIGQASEWTTLNTVIAGILAIVIGLLTGGLGAALVIELSSTFINVGVGAAVAAFTPEVYERFKCNLYCNALADGSWNEAALVAIKEQINIDETGVANTILHGWIDQLGTVGLTNSGRLHLENDVDCSACPCGEWCYTFDFTTSDEGWEVRNLLEFGDIGRYTSTVGFQQRTDWESVDNLTIMSPTFASRVITRVVVEYDPSLSGSDPLVGLYLEGFGPFTDSEPGGTIVDFDGLFVTSTQIALDSDPYPGDIQQWTGALVRVTVYGKGANPFGTDNCP